MKRFWKEATVAADGAHWRVLLDGRAVRTQGGRAQLLPTRALADALAAEWAAQPAEIDPALFPMRDLADYALDVVAADPAEVARGLLAYAETDTLCYRGEPGEALTRRQESEWEPLLAAAEARHAVRFTRISGVIHQPQPPATLAALAAELERHDPLRLAALQTLASLAASLVVALAALDPAADRTYLWNAASLEEDWQAELWGRDPEAEARRARRRAAFLTAAEFAALA